MKKHAYLAKLKPGDKVTSNLYTGEETFIRTLIQIERGNTVSGWRVWVDDGGKCPTCGKRGHAIDGFDGAWIKPVQEAP